MTIRRGSCRYTSQPLQNRDLPQVPGVEIHNPRQQVWNQGSGSIVNIDADTAGSSLLMAKNVAELRYFYKVD